MFKVNDYIMYGMTGVCKVTDIIKERFRNSIEREYYVLIPIYSRNTVIKIPIDNDKITMRKMISKDDIDFLINNINKEEPLWIEDEKERNATFKVMLKSGECDDLMKLIRSIYFNKKNRKELGKKLGKGDEEIMQTAERLLNEEFATILNISPDEVRDYITENVPN